MQIFYAVAVVVVVLSGIIFFGKKITSWSLVRISHSDFKVKLFLCVNNERQKKLVSIHTHRMNQAYIVKTKPMIMCDGTIYRKCPEL